MQVLRGMVGRIVASPEVELYRRIRKSNKDVIEDLGKFKGGEECLIAIGFQLEVGAAPLVVDKTVPVDKGIYSLSAVQFRYSPSSIIPVIYESSHISILPV